MSADVGRRSILSLTQCFFDRSVDRQQFSQARHLEYRVALYGQARQGKGAPMVSTMHKHMYQRADSGRVEERHFAHIQNKLWRRFRPYTLNKTVYGFQA